MIILDLLCDDGHRFEGWFASREAFERQAANGEVHCAVCQSAHVTVLPSGPRLLRHQESASAAPNALPVPAPEHEAAAQLFRALAEMARKAEDVGARFSEEARRIHYDEAPSRNIRGQATREETRELLEEGILVLPAPVPPENETH